MSHYIDGFVFPIPRQQLGDYQQLAESVAEIWCEHGALEYREFVGDDLSLPGTLPFPDVLAAGAGDAIVFGWVKFDSREARDQANEKVAADPRVAKLMGSLDTGFDAARMAYGGFRTLVNFSNTERDGVMLY